MDPRKPAHDAYDVVVDLEHLEPGAVPRYAFALVKLTYELKDGRARPTAPEPLLFDVWRDESLEPRLHPGSDFWPHKLASDVVIQGSAHVPGGNPKASMVAEASIGNRKKRIAVFGRREISWTRSGQIQVGSPEPFLQMPLVYSNTYGGLDPRVPIPDEDREAYMALAEQGLANDHPGGYPRNFVGKGYLVLPGPIEGLEMPNLEDPEDLLSPDRLVVGAPELWPKQPLPWCFEWTDGIMFPRSLYLDRDAWYPCRDARLLPEIRRGLVPPAVLQPAAELPSEFYQEASFGMVFRTPLAGQPVSLTGMHPEEPVLRFSIPADPTIEFNVEGSRSVAKPLLTNLVIKPAEKKFSVVYCAKQAPLPRGFLPEIHKNIPISVRVNQGPPIPYVAPPTIRDRLASARPGQPPS